MAISTVGTIKQRHQTAVANNPAYDISATVQKDSYVLASGAGDGFALVKDSAQGDGWGVGFAKMAGPTAPRTYTLPDANAIMLTDQALVTVSQGGTGLATLAAGALLYGAGASAMVALPIVAAGSVLVSGPSPAWSASPTLTALNFVAAGMGLSNSGGDFLIAGATVGGDIYFWVGGHAAWRIGGAGATGHLLPTAATNTLDIGSPTALVHSVNIGTALVVGTNPADATDSADIRLRSGFLLEARNNANTANGKILSTDAQDKSVLGGQSIVLANNAVASLGATPLGALFIVSTSSSTYGHYVIGASAHFTVLVYDPSSLFSGTAGTASRINVYWSVGNARYEIENKLGGTTTFMAIVIGNS
jgi:hypothetical protein